MAKRPVPPLILLLVMSVYSGCAVTEIAQDQYVAMKNFTVGEYYLQPGYPQNESDSIFSSRARSKMKLRQ